jgi:hypothetical protein
MKILLMGWLFGKMKNFKHIIPFLMTLLFLATPNIFWAQDSNWPWIPDGENFQITKNLGDDFSPAITSNGHLYFVVWYKRTKSGFDIYGTRVTQNGDILDRDGIPICTASNDQMFPAVASDGKDFLVVWQDMRSGKRWDIYGAMVTADDGQVLNTDVFPNGFPIALGKSADDQMTPALAFDGENYLVVWQGKAASKVWNVYFSMVSVSKDGEVAVKGKKAISPIPKNQVSPAVAFNGENYFVVWQDFRSGKFWDIYGARVTPFGEILDHKGFTISPTFEGDISGLDKWRPVLSWDGNFFLVIWMVSREEGRWGLEGKRVTGDGEWVDLLDILIQEDTTNKIFPALLWDGDHYVLVWEEEPEGESKIFGVSILPQYKPFIMSEVVEISSPEMRKSSIPGISKIEDEVLIIWQGKGPEDNWQIYGQCFKKQSEITSEL